MATILDYGGKLIPLKENGKKPATKFAGVDFTPQFMASHIQNGGNVGLLVQPNFIFIDIDVSHGDDGMHNFIDWLLKNGIEPKSVIEGTLSAQTASGGYHLIFLRPKGYKLRQDIAFLDGVDIKASKNNYIVICPSKIDGSSYKWLNQLDPVYLPKPLADALQKKEKKTKKEAKKRIRNNEIVDGLRYSTGFTKYPRLDVFYTIEHGFGDVGVRNDNLFKWTQEMRRATDVDTALQYADIANKNTTPPLDTNEMQKTIQSAYNFQEDYEVVEAKGKQFVKLNSNGGVNYAVLIEKYDETQSKNPDDYVDEDLYRCDFMSKYNPNVKSVYTYEEK